MYFNEELWEDAMDRWNDAAFAEWYATFYGSVLDPPRPTKALHDHFDKYCRPAWEIQ